LIDFVRQHSQLPAADLLRELRHTLQEFAGGQPLADDTTIVVGKLVA
jgi:serine phosphatase RsbU (regulator of sigma subunit)